MSPLLHLLPADVVRHIYDLAQNKIWVIKTIDGHTHYVARPAKHRDIASVYNVRVRKRPFPF